MGLLPSCMRRQSRDLRDSAADDNHVSRNGHGAGRRGRSWKGSYPQNTVRLLWTRTLSTAGDTNSWMGPAGSLVLENGERDLKKLLADTRPVGRWQERLQKLLLDYIIADDAFLALGFLEKNMDTAIIAVKDPSQSLGYPALFIDIKHKPQIFNLQHWKDIMIALHFELTEPEGNSELDLVEVKVTRQVTLGSLLGFKFLLQCLSKMDWDMIRMLLALTNEAALRLVTVLQTLHHGHVDMSTIQDLYSRYPHELSALGFSVTQNRKKKGLTWHPQPSDSVHNVEVGLIGLFHNGAGLETFI